MIDALTQRLAAGEMTRIVAYGSSNTERFMPWLNWFDWLDLAIRSRYGKNHLAINAGIGGDTTRGLLARFDRFVAACRPDVVIVTIGGNDSAPGHGISAEEFAGNLRRLVARIGALPQPCLPVLQTYYSADLEVMAANEGEERAARFTAFMQAVRDVAAAEGCPLVDHLAGWEVLRTGDLRLYRSLMTDAMHLNAEGNLLMGVVAARHVGIGEFPAEYPLPPPVAAALAVMDRGA